jgi:hypothetical protein
MALINRINEPKSELIRILRNTEELQIPHAANSLGTIIGKLEGWQRIQSRRATGEG